MPVPYFKNMSPMAKGATEANGLLKRMAKRVDELTRFVATLETDWGIEMSSDGLGRVRLSLAYAPNAGGGGLGNSAFVAKATPEEGQNVDTYEVRMLGGTVQGIFGAIEVIETTVFVGIGEGEIFWLEFDPNGTPGSQWSVEHDDELPASATTPAADNPNYFAVIPLFKVEAEAGGEDVNVIQYHYGSVYVPTVTNVVQVQDLPASEEEEEE